MDSTNISKIINLSSAVHDLLQGVGACEAKTHKTRVFRTVEGLLKRIDGLVDDAVVGEIKAIQLEIDKPKAMQLTDVLKLGIGALRLPSLLHAPLVKAGINQLADLADLTAGQLAELDGIGNAGAEKIMGSLQDIGFQLAQ